MHNTIDETAARCPIAALRAGRVVLALLAVTTMPSGCVRAPRVSEPVVHGVRFHNATATPITDVRLTVQSIGGVVGCSFMPAASECSASFPLRRYQGNAVQVGWLAGGRQYLSEERVLSLPADFDRALPFDVEVTISGGGEVSTVLRQ